jgi:hypothetical protein
MAVHSHGTQIMTSFVEFDHASGSKDNVTKIVLWPKQNEEVKKKTRRQV